MKRPLLAVALPSFATAALAEGKTRPVMSTRDVAVGTANSSADFILPLVIVAVVLLGLLSSRSSGDQYR